MLFGLTNSLATFQTVMNEIFKELIDEGVVVVFIDDILIFTESIVKLCDESSRSFVPTTYT